MTIFAASITLTRSIVPRLMAVPSSIFSPAAIVPDDNVVDVRPVANLRAVAPDFKRIVFQKCAFT